MHVPGCDRPDQTSSALRPDREGYEQRPAGAVSSDCNQAVLIAGMVNVRRDARASSQQGFDLSERHSVLLAFIPVSVVPIEAGDRNVHRHI